MLTYALLLLALGKIDHRMARAWDAPLVFALVVGGMALVQGRGWAVLWLTSLAGGLSFGLFWLLRRYGDQIALWLLILLLGTLFCSFVLAGFHIGLR
ncbi:hypothetical protein [Chitinimonas sp.]|uniref:hypothetical protein n=1 Tax=Chitinimonas sp. TaxID=1934313 RepID=UPI002F93270B